MTLKEDLTIELVRHERKIWSYAENRPNRVEMAVLDYFRSDGWSGYFTERHNYFALCIMVIGWTMFKDKCNLTTKKDTRAYYKEAKHALQYGAKGLFFHARDGYLPTHSVDCDEIYEYFLNYDQSRFHDSVQTFMTEKISSFDIATYYQAMGSAKDINALELTGFFNRFGMDDIIIYIYRFFSKDRVEAMRRLFEFDGRYFGWRSSGISARYYAGFDSQLVRVLNPNAVKIGIGMESLFHPAFDCSEEYSENIEKVRYFAENLLCAVKKSEILSACDLSDKWRNRILEDRAKTTLDLQLWKDGKDMIVEVKAPNDRLSKRQINKIIETRREGGVALVVKVVEKRI